MSEHRQTRSETSRLLEQGNEDNLLGPDALPPPRRRRAKLTTTSTSNQAFYELLDDEQIQRMDDDTTYDVKKRVPAELKRALGSTGKLTPSSWYEIKDGVTGVLARIPDNDPSIPQGCGFAHIICDEPSWREQTGDNTATLPGRPDPGPEPTYPTGTGGNPPESHAVSAHTAQQKQWWRKVEHRKAFDTVHTNVKELFAENIPEESSRFKNRLGIIPPGLSARDVIASIEPTIVTDLKKD